MAGACAPPCRHGTCLPVLPPRRLDVRNVATQLPAPLSLSLALLLSSCSLSLSPEALPPPQLVTDALPAVPSPLRRAPELRRDPLYLLVEPRKTEHPVEPMPSPNSPPAAVDPRWRFGSYRASPTSPSRSLVSL